MIPEPGDTNREVPVNETFHIQTDDELTEKELKQIEADDQAIQTILLGLPEDIYAAVDSYRQMQMVGGNGENQFQQYAGQNVGNLNGGVGHFTRNCTVRPRRRDVAYLQTQLLIAQKEEAGIQLQTEEFDLMAATTDLDEIEEVNANCILMANLQQASTSSTQTDRAPIYDSDGSAEVHDYENCYDNKIFNVFTQEEQYTELLEPIPESHQVPQNDNNVISEVTSMEQSREIVEQHPANVEETRALYDSLYYNLAIEVEKVNTINRKLKETNAKLTTELANLKIKKSVLKLVKKNMTNLKDVINKISDLNKQLSKEKSTVSFHLEEKKKLKSDFKIRKDELLDKQIQLDKRINELDNILVKTGHSIQTIHMLSPKPVLFYHTEQKIALGYQNPFYLKQAQKKQQSLYDGKVLFEKHDHPVVLDSEETLQLAQEKAAKIFGDFKSLAKEANESLAKQKALELEIERLLKVVVSQDIMSVVQNNSVVDASNLQIELERTRERFENCIIRKENEYTKLWND
nr:hypothetical protein [Tanacetum cinerariifolium]